MTKLLIILILIAGNDADPAGKALAERLILQGGDRVQVLVGPPALAALARRDVHDADLLATPEVGIALTGQDRALAVIRLERRDRGKDAVLETRVWVDGRSESYVTIAGAAVGDEKPAEPGAERGTLAILGPWISEAGTRPGNGPSLARLATLEDWAALLAASAGDAPGPRELYYRAMAHHHLGHEAEALATVTALRTAHPGHVLVTAAEALLPTKATVPLPEGEINDLTPDDDGSNVLK